MRTSHLTLRPLTPDELSSAHRLLLLAFGDAFDQADLEAERAVFEYERSLGTFDGDELVGCLGTYSFDMSVPGGSLPVAGTTWVAVSPTHRRRGLLTGAMRRHLADVAARGEPLAALWASETAIYGRFGYGPAIDRLQVDITVDPGLAWEATAPPPADQVSLVGLDEAYETVDPIYRAARARRAGMHSRNETWWGYQALSTRRETLQGAKAKYVAVAEVDGRDAAYAIYGMTPSWGDDGRAAGTLQVIELAGLDPAAEAAMWRYLLGHDLIGRVKSDGRPVDDPLHLLLADSRRVQRRPLDALHVRVVDLPAALRGRGYAESAGVTVEIRDELLEANDGTWRVEVAPEGVAVEPAEGATPDLRMDIRALGSLYMGDVPLRRLVAAGRVEVVNPTVVGPVDAAFTAAEAGWVPEVW